jgi:hypothetical protein
MISSLAQDLYLVAMLEYEERDVYICFMRYLQAHTATIVVHGTLVSALNAMLTLQAKLTRPGRKRAIIKWASPTEARPHG